eukprot:1453897-Rhodomonas_salina.1
MSATHAVLLFDTRCCPRFPDKPTALCVLCEFTTLCVPLSVTLIHSLRQLIHSLRQLIHWPRQLLHSLRQLIHSLRQLIHSLRQLIHSLRHASTYTLAASTYTLAASRAGAERHIAGVGVLQGASSAAGGGGGQGARARGGRVPQSEQSFLSWPGNPNCVLLLLFRRNLRCARMRSFTPLYFVTPEEYGYGCLCCCAIVFSTSGFCLASGWSLGSSGGDQGGLSACGAKQVRRQRRSVFLRGASFDVMRFEDGVQF